MRLPRSCRFNPRAVKTAPMQNTHMNTSGGTASPNTTPRIRRPTLRWTAHTSCSPTALSRSTSRRTNKCLCSTNPTPPKILRADPGLQPAPGEWEIENPHHLNPSCLRCWGATYGDGTSVVVMAGRTCRPASDVDHRGIHHWRLGVGAAISRLVRTSRNGPSNDLAHRTMGSPGTPRAQ
jgi:hypothetical protein